MKFTFENDKLLFLCALISTNEAIGSIVHRGYTDLEEEHVLEVLNKDASLMKGEGA